MNNEQTRMSFKILQASDESQRYAGRLFQTAGTKQLRAQAL